MIARELDELEVLDFEELAQLDVLITMCAVLPAHLVACTELVELWWAPSKPPDAASFAVLAQLPALRELYVPTHLAAAALAVLRGRWTRTELSPDTVAIVYRCN